MHVGMADFYTKKMNFERGNGEAQADCEEIFNDNGLNESAVGSDSSFESTYSGDSDDSAAKKDLGGGSYHPGSRFLNSFDKKKKKPIRKNPIRVRPVVAGPRPEVVDLVSEPESESDGYDSDATDMRGEVDKGRIGSSSAFPEDNSLIIGGWRFGYTWYNPHLRVSFLSFPRTYCPEVHARFTLMSGYRMGGGQIVKCNFCKEEYTVAGGMHAVDVATDTSPGIPRLRQWVGCCQGNCRVV